MQSYKKRIYIIMIIICQNKINWAWQNKEKDETVGVLTRYYKDAKTTEKIMKT